MDPIILNFIPDYDALKRDPAFQRAIAALAARLERIEDVPNEELRTSILDFVAAVYRHSRQEINQEES